MYIGDLLPAHFIKKKSSQLPGYFNVISDRLGFTNWRPIDVMYVYSFSFVSYKTVNIGGHDVRL